MHDARAERQAVRGEPPDRLELEDAAFFERIATGYESLASDDPARVRIIWEKVHEFVAEHRVTARLEDDDRCAGLDFLP